MHSLAEVYSPKQPQRTDRPAPWRAPVLALVLLCVQAAAAQANSTASILFVSSHTSTPYLQFVEKTRQILRAGSLPSVTTTELSASQLLGNHSAADNKSFDMVVALGTQAAQALQYWQPQAPVLYALIPQATYHSLRESGRLTCPDNRCTAVYIDQPLPRLLDILGAAFGDRKHPGVLLGPTSAHNDSLLAELGRQRKLSLQIARVTSQDELLPALNSLLKHADLLLSIPDPVVYNRQTAKSVLLTTYRYKVPVLAYSRAYADAGAALSVYSTPAQMARQAADIIETFLTDHKRRLPPPGYPQHFTLRINRHVADALGLDLESSPELRSFTKDTDDEQAEYSE